MAVGVQARPRQDRNRSEQETRTPRGLFGGRSGRTKTERETRVPEAARIGVLRRRRAFSAPGEDGDERAEKKDPSGGIHSALYREHPDRGTNGRPPMERRRATRFSGRSKGPARRTSEQSDHKGGWPTGGGSGPR